MKRQVVLDFYSRIFDLNVIFKVIKSMKYVPYIVPDFDFVTSCAVLCCVFNVWEIQWKVDRLRNFDREVLSNCWIDEFIYVFFIRKSGQEMPMTVLFVRLCWTFVSHTLIFIGDACSFLTLRYSTAKMWKYILFSIFFGSN